MRGLRMFVAVAVSVTLTCGVLPPSAAVADTRTARTDMPLRRLDAQGVVRLLDADDQIPGVPLDTYPVVSHTVTGTLDAYPTTEPPADGVDVYSVYLAPGDQISLVLAGTGVNFDLYLWSPASLTVQSAEYVLSSDGPAASEHICYTASSRFGAGRYYVAVSTFDSEGSYTLEWQVSGRSDGNVPGVELTSRAVTGTVDPVSDGDDVFRLWLPEGQSATCTLTAEAPGDTFELWLLPPRWNNGGILEDTQDVYHAAEGFYKKGASVTITTTVGDGRGGWHYIDVRAGDSGGGYTLQWEVGVDIPGVPLQGAITTGTLPAVSVFSTRPLRWGQTVHASLWVTPTAAPTDMRLWEPGAFSITGDPARVVAEDSGSFAYEVPDESSEGAHFLEVAGAGSPLFALRTHVVTESRRLAGADRYATAVRISQSTFREGANTVVVASGAGFADAVAASSLAGAYDAPLLLVGSDSLPSVVSSEIARLGATQAFVVGGPAAVSARVVDAIDALAGMDTPTRVAGPDRYATSAEVTRRVLSRLGPDWDGGVFVARGDAFPDALAVGPLAWQSMRPVILTRPTVLPLASAELLDQIAPVQAVIVGGTSAVSASVEERVDSLAGEVQRVDGADRYATAANVAAYGIDQGIVQPRFVGLATGATFPDALAGGVACGVEKGVLLLTSPDALAPKALAFVQTRCDLAEMDAARVFGGTAAVHDSAVARLDESLAYTWVEAPPAWW
ncbi:MAG: cell wall-binding repeat-containing protein [Coriobacteriales bacterium]